MNKTLDKSHRVNYCRLVYGTFVGDAVETQKTWEGLDMEFWMSTDKPAPARKRKQITSALEEHEEYLKIKQVILSGRMKPMQSAIITMGPKDAEKLGYKWPWRTAVDSLRRLVKSMNLEADYSVRKYETDTPGVWAIMATYEPPMTKAQPHAEAVQAARRGRPRKTA